MVEEGNTIEHNGHEYEVAVVSDSGDREVTLTATRDLTFREYLELNHNHPRATPSDDTACADSDLDLVMSGKLVPQGVMRPLDEDENVTTTYIKHVRGDTHIGLYDER